MAERIDDLQFEGLKIYQNDDGYCFTTDSVLLANYSKCLAKAKVVEFCAGSGVVSILFSKKQKPQSIHAFELQKSLYDLFVKSVELNNLQYKIFPHNEDLKNALESIEIDGFTLAEIFDDAADGTLDATISAQQFFAVVKAFN